MVCYVGRRSSTDIKGKCHMAKKDKKRERISAKQRAEKYQPGNSENTVLRLPNGLNKIIIKETKSVRWSIIPFEATKMNPLASKFNMVGQPYVERTYWAHGNVGPENKMYACPYHNTKHLDKPSKCPICEYRKKLMSASEPDEDLIKSLVVKERQLWLIYDHEDPEKGVQLFDASMHALGKHIDEAIREDEDGVYEYFADPEDGSMLKIKFTETSTGGTRPWYPATRIDFKPRSKPLADKIYEHGIDVDAIVSIPSYDELSAIFFQESEDTSKSAKSKKADEDDDDDDDEDEKPAKGKAKGKGKK